MKLSSTIAALSALLIGSGESVEEHTIPPKPKPTNSSPFNLRRRLTEISGGTCLMIDRTNILRDEGVIVGDYCLDQQGDGNFRVLKGGCDNNSGELLYHTGFSTAHGDFYTRLQGDGNLVTRKGTATNPSDVVWKSDATGNPASDWFLFLSSDECKLCIYEGTTHQPVAGTPLWCDDTRKSGCGCTDYPSWWYDSDGMYYDCDWYALSSSYCDWYGGGYENFGMCANEACCACGGGI